MMDWEKIAAQTPIPGFVGKVMHSDSMSFVLWEIAAGTLLPEHAHLHEQVVHMLDGTFELTVDGRTETLSRGQVAAIPSNARHSGRALTDCRILDAFCPVREDYRNGLTSSVISGTANG
ncbi:cupin domain-containing protein [Mesorhizobium sp. ASY16-5R]|uniref:cupin domain-containing protein n=1 Tax=Mesorhizobium sp. ASY16-5R TaxID=3445772 RepID=UPI003F9FDCFA